MLTRQFLLSVERGCHFAWATCEGREWPWRAVLPRPCLYSPGSAFSAWSVQCGGAQQGPGRLSSPGAGHGAWLPELPWKLPQASRPLASAADVLGPRSVLPTAPFSVSSLLLCRASRVCVLGFLSPLVTGQLFPSRLPHRSRWPPHRPTEPGSSCSLGRGQGDTWRGRLHVSPATSKQASVPGQFLPLQEVLPSHVCFSAPHCRVFFFSF